MLMATVATSTQSTHIHPSIFTAFDPPAMEIENQIGAINAMKATQGGYKRSITIHNDPLRPGLNRGGWEKMEMNEILGFSSRPMRRPAEADRGAAAAGGSSGAAAAPAVWPQLRSASSPFGACGPSPAPPASPGTALLRCLRRCHLRCHLRCLRRCHLRRCLLHRPPGEYQSESADWSGGLRDGGT